MSYDIDIGDEEYNYTSNVGEMYHKHIEHNGITGVQCLDGLTGKQAGDVLKHAFDNILWEVLDYWHRDTVGEPQFCKLYDSPNGWGSTVGGLLFLAQVMAGCYANPRCKVRVSA